MKRRDLQNLAWKSFVYKNLSTYFTRIYLIKAFLIAISLSFFLYAEYFNLSVLVLNSVCAFFGFWFLLGQHRVVWFWSGFFIGLLWFHWIGFSFVYYNLTLMIPFIILAIALVYGVWFWAIGKWIKNLFLQAFLLWGMSFIAPFNFNWFKPELILLNTYFSPNTLHFALFLIAIVLFKMHFRWAKLTGIGVCSALLLVPHYLPTKTTLPPITNVFLPNVHIPQSQRWDKAYQEEAIRQNFALIEHAIKQGDAMIILPESAFPVYLNLDDALIERLKTYSYSISIVAGSLTYEKDQYFNSSYLFEEGQMHIAHKIVLVPFGEEVPFPDFLVTLINRLFFDGAHDYAKAKEPFDFKIQGEVFRSAICYEATTDTLYANHPRYMIAISNNAWFTPSIEPTLQYLLLQLYAKKYNTVIYHSANAGKSGVIVP